jgi:hypothetical protein
MLIGSVNVASSALAFELLTRFETGERADNRSEQVSAIQPLPPRSATARSDPASAAPAFGS